MGEDWIQQPAGHWMRNSTFTLYCAMAAQTQSCNTFCHPHPSLLDRRAGISVLPMYQSQAEENSLPGMWSLYKRPLTPILRSFVTKKLLAVSFSVNNFGTRTPFPNELQSWILWEYKQHNSELQSVSLLNLSIYAIYYMSFSAYRPIHHFW